MVGTFANKYVLTQAQRVAPGVPPQHYQQQPIHQMHQQPPAQHMPQHQQQYQQVPIQQQQIPIQQQQPQHQQPQHAQHQQQHIPVQQTHHHQERPQEILNAANIAQEKDHVAAHMEVPLDTSKMTDQELQFHYFKMHDADNNNMLDGCELIKSLIHWHEQGKKGHTAPDKLFTDDELINLIDPILSMDDIDQDGFINYPEFIRAQKNAAASGHQ